MAGVYKGLTIRIGADTTGLSGALNRIDSQTRSLKREMSAVNKALKLDPGNAELARQKMELYQKEVKSTSERLKTLKEAESQIGKDGMSTEAWDTLQREIAVTEGKLKQLTAEYKAFAVEQAAAASGIGRAGAALTSLGGKLDPIGQKAQSAGRALTVGLTVPMAAAAAASVKAAVDIDAGLTDVRKTVDGTEEDFQRLKEAAIDFSQTNAVKAADLLSIESLGAQLGYTLDLMSNGKSEVQEFGEVVSGLDIATNMSAEQAGTELAQFFNIMREDKEMTENFGSAIVGLGNSFATTESDISAMAMRIAGAGKNIGLSSADVLGLSTALTSLGINAEAGGTAISTVMSEVDKSVAFATEYTSEWARATGTSMSQFVSAMREGGPAAEQLAAKVGMSQDEIIGYLDSSGDAVSDWAHAAGMRSAEFAALWADKPVEAFAALMKGMQGSVKEGGNLSVILEELGIGSIRQTDMLKRLANSGDLMTRTVAKANEEWERNDALANEVANRNGSLAAKFDILRNRVIAVAEDVGTPLADAMLSAVDAAQPLFEAVESGARAFSEMDEAEQRNVMATVAIIAALGPALSLFGKLASNVKVLGGALSTLSKGFATVDLATNGTAKSLKAAGLATEDMTVKQAAASVGMGALKTAAVGLALAGIAVLAAAIADYVAKQETMRKATDGVADAVARMKDGSEIAAIGADRLADSSGALAARLGEYRKAAEEAAEKGAEFADSINGKIDSAEADAVLVENYAARITELAGSCDGSADKLAALNDAVGHYNELTGSSLTVVDDFTGRLNEQNDVIEANTELYKLNAHAKAYADVAYDAARRVAELTVEIEGQTYEMEAHRKALDGMVASGEAVYDEYGNLVGAAAIEQAAIDELGHSISDLNSQREAAQKAEDRAIEMGRSASNAADAEAEKLKGLVASVDGYRAALEELGAGGGALDRAFDAARDSAAGFEGDIASFTAALDGAGIGARQLAKVAIDDFARLYQEAGGSLDGVSRALALVDTFQIDPKHIVVTDDGTVKLNMGLVDGLDRKKLADKGFRVSDDGTIQNTMGMLTDLGLMTANPTVDVRDYASAKIDYVLARMNELDARRATGTMDFMGPVAFATGALLEHPLRIPRHADGGISGIVTRATLTSAGLVGEAGAEYVHDFGGGSAIVPIENSRYVRPLAKAITAEMPRQGGDTTVMNVYLDGVMLGAGVSESTTLGDLAKGLRMKARR